MPTLDLIIFGVQSALKLGQRGRLAYVDTLRRRDLLMPLANFEPGVNINNVRTFFQQFPPEGPLTPDKQVILDQIMNSDAVGIPHGPEREAAEQFFREQKLVQDIRRGRFQNDPLGNQNPMATLSLLRVAQNSAQNETSLNVAERLAGTLIDIGIDYFQANPGAINENARLGKAFRATITALDAVQFGETGLGSLPRRMIFAVLEAVEGDAAGLVDDPEAQALISAVAGGLGNDVRARLDAIGEQNNQKREHVAQWGETVLRSVLGSAGRMVAEDPERFLGLKTTSGQAMTRQVASELLDIVLNTDAGDLSDVFQKGSLDRLAATALGVLGEHPGMVASGNGLKQVIGGVAADLAARSNVLDIALIPETVRLVVEKTGRNMDRFWSNDRDSEGLDLLKTAAANVLENLAEAPADGDTWRPRFTSAQALDLVDTVLDQIADNPGWLAGHADDVEPLLGTALSSMLTVLKSRAEKGLKPETGLAMTKAGIIAAAQQIRLVERADNGQPIVAAALDLVLSRAFNPGLDAQAKAALLREEVLTGVHQAILNGLGRTRLGSDILNPVAAVLDDVIGQVADGAPLVLDDLEVSIEAALEGAGQ